jgi:uncharacterized protein
MTQPPDSSGAGLGDPSPEENQAPPQQWGDPPPAGQAPPPGYNPPPGYYAPPPVQPPHPGQYPAAPPPYWGPPAFGLSPQEERTWAMFAHVGAILASFVGIPFLGPLIVMLTQGTKSAFVRRHAVESLNFQLMLMIAVVAGVLLSILTLGIGLLVFIPVAIVGSIVALVFTVIGGIKANNGEDYRYPVNFRMVK